MRQYLGSLTNYSDARSIFTGLPVEEPEHIIAYSAGANGIAIFFDEEFKYCPYSRRHKALPYTKDEITHLASTTYSGYGPNILKFLEAVEFPTLKVKKYSELDI